MTTADLEARLNRLAESLPLSDALDVLIARILLEILKTVENQQ